jgi:hypothetical protein
MILALRKSPFVKLWIALILFGGFCAWILPLAVKNYCEYKSMEQGIDIIAKECAARGGCTFYTRLEY